MSKVPVWPLDRYGNFCCPESMDFDLFEACVRCGISVCCGTCAHYQDERGAGFEYRMKPLWTDVALLGYRSTAYSDLTYEMDIAWPGCCDSFALNEKQKTRLAKRLKQREGISSDKQYKD